MKRILLLLWLLNLSPVVQGLTLAEYGVSLTGSGLVDHVSGLQWLDSDLTQGGLDDLQFWLDAGWRIASEEEVYFLISRQQSEFGGIADVPLHVDDFMSMLTSLSLGIEGQPGPWACRAYGDPETYCNSVNSFGGQVFLVVEAHPSLDQTHLEMYVYLSEVPIYGSLDCFIDPSSCDFTGRTLMVRAVPLPATVCLLLSALAVMRRRQLI